jgi:hypothetical protein
MTIQLQARRKGEKAWGVRAAYNTENAKVFAFESNPRAVHGRDTMTRDQLLSLANSDMNKWMDSGSEHGVEFRVVDTEKEAKR